MPTSLQRPGSITTSQIKLSTWTIFCADRTHDSRRGEVNSVYINDAWSSNLVKVDGQCLPDFEFKMPTILSAQRIHQYFCCCCLHSFRCKFRKLQDCMRWSAITWQNSRMVLAGDFNQTDLRSVLTQFCQYVHTSTRGNNTLEHVYMNICGTYNQTTFPCFSCLPTSSWLERSNHQKKTVKIWTDEATAALQDCFECTDWHKFQRCHHPGEQQSWEIYIISDIIHQQMCWWYGDHKDNKIIP